MPVNTTYSRGTTVLSDLSLTGDQGGNLRAVHITVPSGPVLSSGALDLRTNSAVISMVTVANSDSMTIGQLRLVFAASGISLVYSSGATVYTIGGSAVSAAQG